MKQKTWLRFQRNSDKVFLFDEDCMSKFRAAAKSSNTTSKEPAAVRAQEG